MIAARAPSLPNSDRQRFARVSVQMFRALLPLILGARARERAALIEELKRALTAYLEESGLH
jgi:hypothetical protein